MQIKSFKVQRTIHKRLLSMTERKSNNWVFIMARNFKLFKRKFNVKSVQRKFIFVEKKSNGFHTIHAFCPNCTLSWIPATMSYHPEKGWINADNPFYSCCDPLKGKTLTIAYNGYTPVVIYPPSNDTKDQRVSGIDPDIMRTVGKRLGFRPFFRKEGFDLKGLGWQGKIGKVMRGRAHIGIATPFSHEHFQVVQFTQFNYYSRLVFRSRMPIELKYALQLEIKNNITSFVIYFFSAHSTIS